MGQGGAPFGCIERFANKIESRRVRLQMVRDHFQITDNDGQEVIEIVRHAAGQLADSLHLLGLAQHFLGMLCVGDIVADKPISDHRTVIVAHEEIVGEQGVRRTVGKGDRDFRPDCIAALEYGLVHGVDGIRGHSRK